MKNEGKTTSRVEEQTKKIPSMAFLNLALGSMAVSLGLQLAGRKQWANFIGQWAPTLLILGVYNKLAKTFSEQAEPVGPFSEGAAGEHPVVQ
jgi:hypothetical protein